MPQLSTKISAPPAHPHEFAASRILHWLHHAERELVGKSARTFNGEMGSIKDVKLDELHGLSFTFDVSGHRQRWYPVSTIRGIVT